MSRRVFDHLHTEASVATGHRLPRYALWLAVHAEGANPERLSADDALVFCRRSLPGFLNERGLRLEGPAARHLERAVARFDPARPEPWEHFAALA